MAVRSLKRAVRFAWLLLIVSCREHAPTPPAPNASLAAGASSSQTPDSNLLADPNPENRRRAVRGLAREPNEQSLELLRRSLADADPEVISWSAFGLGDACSGHEQENVRALVARAASLPDGLRLEHSPLWLPEQAIADALGRCGGREAEATLRVWLAGSNQRAEAAALGLGRIAGKGGQLDDATIVALLDAAARPEHPLDYALYPFTRLGSLSAPVGARLLQQAEHALERPSPASEFAVRALARVHEGGTEALFAALTKKSLASGTRASAARELALLGSSAQVPLQRALVELVAAPPSDASLLDASFGIVLALLDSLKPPARESSATLQTLASLPLTGNETPALLRRKVKLRCSAASVLAGSSITAAPLLACDPQKAGRQGALALVHTLDRAPLTRSRARALIALAESDDPVVEEAALGLIPGHSELPEAHRMLAKALASQAPGVVASAARVLAAYPNRAAAEPDQRSDERAAPRPDPSVLTALSAAFTRYEASPNLELRSLLIDAAGSVELLGLKSKIVLACASDNPTLREHAEKSLRLLGDGARKCSAPPGATAPATAAAVNSRYELTLITDAGQLSLTLDGTLAPSAVARVVELAQSGFYDGLSMHRVVPGFVVQFGDPGGDGYGGADRPALRCERAPVSFEASSVGIALAGRDTGNSQLFVTLGRHPHLDGDYTLIGNASPGWERIVEGDRIEHVSVVARPPP